MQKEETEKPSPYKRLDLDNLLDNLKTNFQTKLKLTPIELERLDKIQKSSHILDDNVNQLEKTIKAILDKQYDEYVKTFEQFMDSVRKELRAKIEQMEEEEKKRQKLNDIRIIKCERDFFRLEAIRLNGLCKDMSTKIEEMAFQMKLLSNEGNNMTTKWKESENINKQLLVELESNIQAMRELEKERTDLKEQISMLTLNQPRALPQIQTSYPPNYQDNEGNVNNINEEQLNEYEDEGNYPSNNDNNNNGNVNEYDMVMKREQFLHETIRRLKADLKKERLRNHKTLSEFNKMILNKNKLELIFQESVEEVRKDIFNRKLKETMDANYAKNRRSNSKAGKTQITIPYISDIKYQNYLPKDKQKIMEAFILNEEVIGIVKDLIFNKSRDEIEQFKNPQQINILNENRIHSPEVLKSNSFTKNNFDITKQARGTFFKSRYNLSNSFGKKTHLNFGMGVKLSNIK